MRDGQRCYWDTEAYQRPFDHPIQRFFANQRAAFLDGIIPWGQVELALDVGCGQGVSSFYLRDRFKLLVSVDIALRQLRHTSPLLNRVCADMLHLPFADGAFDLVQAWEVLHHCRDLDGALREMRRVSRRYVALFEPNRANPGLFLFALLKPEERLLLSFSRRYLQSGVQRANLTVLHSATVGWIPPNRIPTVVFRFLKRLPFSPVPFVGLSHFILCSV